MISKNKQEKMRVLMIAQSNYNYDARIIRLATALKNRNINVDVICLRYEGQNSYDIVNGVNIYRIMKNFSQESILSYVLGSLIFMLLSLFKAIKLELDNKYNLVHVHNMPDYLVFSAAMHKLKRVPVILDIHDLTVELFKEKWSEKKFNRFKHILKFSEKLSCSFADRVLTVTKECVDNLVQRGIPKEKITLIMNSADESQFTFSDQRFNRNGTGNFRLVYHGTIAPRFGLHFIINAMPHILKAIPGAELHFYGSYRSEYANEIREKVRTLGIENAVIFNHHIPYNQVNDMIKEYDMGVVTYEQTEYMNLAMPTKAGEYALTGLPFIISDMISVRSVFSENSVKYVDPEDPISIAESIIRMKSDVEKRKQMALSALEDMKRISWNVMKNKYLDLVYSLTHYK